MPASTPTTAAEPVEECGRCRFSVRRNGHLFCRRYPPRPYRLPTDEPPHLALQWAVWSEQPETDQHDWCGEFRPAVSHG